MEREKKARLIGLLLLFLMFGVLYVFSVVQHEAIHRQIFGYYGCESYTEGSTTYGKTTGMNPDDRHDMLFLHSMLEIVTYIVDIALLLMFILLSRRYVV